MDLKEFVSETLISIITGVTDAQEKANEYGAFVNPAGLMRSTSNVSNNAIWDNSTNNYAQSIAFDVAVTAEDAGQGGAKIKVFSGIISGELGGEKSNKNSVASRVQFSIPILFPAHDIKKPDARKPGGTRKVISEGIKK
ncbi:MAG: hypothetical protein LWW87_05660 [Geobacteraceae bacterium]|nr:hypothetical protein [Geobacteraceae bacterium]